jgi:glycosyltransferase involved in cell wall biosynthesis
MKGFLSKKELLNELRSPRVFISCGHGEHWVISIYEAAFFCHPLILSLDAGAGSEYLRNGSNGIFIKGRDIDDIERAMIKFHNLQNSDLESYARVSSQLSKKHDSEFFVSEVIPFIMKDGNSN